jgi:hypothetical protein
MVPAAFRPGELVTSFEIFPVSPRRLAIDLDLGPTSLGPRSR